MDLSRWEILRAGRSCLNHRSRVFDVEVLEEGVRGLVMGSEVSLEGLVDLR